MSMQLLIYCLHNSSSHIITSNYMEVINQNRASQESYGILRIDIVGI